MVRRLLSVLSLNVEGIHHAAYLLALSAFSSQILALIRDRLLAHNFGAGSELDIYYAAFRIQDLIFFSIASLVSLSVLIPFLIDKLDRSEEETHRFINGVFSAFFASVVVVSGIAFLLAPFIIPIIFPGLIGRGFDHELLLLTRILLLSPILLGISNLLASITQIYRKFFIYALSPILYNIGIIFGILVFYPIFGIMGLAFGVILGALLHLLIQLPFIISQGFLPRFTLKFNLAELKAVIALSLPRTIALSANHVATLVLVAIASLMEAGSISVFNFSFNIQSIPISIIGASYSVAAFPVLARHFQKGEHKEYIEHLSTAMRHIIFWSFPALVLLIVLRAQVVRVILGSGAFSWNDTRLTAACLALFAVSIVAQNLSLLFVRGYYASGNTRKPLLISVISAISIIGFAYGSLFVFNSNHFFRYFLESLLRVEDISGTAVLVLPLAVSLGSLLNLALFSFVFRRDFSSFFPSVRETVLHSFAASVFMGFCAYNFLDYFGSIFDINTFVGIFSQGFFSGLFGIAAGVFLLFMMKNVEFSEILTSLRHKISGEEIIVAEGEI